MTTHEHDRYDTPDDVRDIASALDELATRERAAAPAALEERIFQATRGTVLRAEQPPLRFPAPPNPRVRLFTGIRMAAAVALCGAAAALWLGQRSPEGVPTIHQTALAAGTLEDDVDLMLALRTIGLDSVGERIDVLFSDTAAVRDSLKSWDALLDGDSL